MEWYESAGRSDYNFDTPAPSSSAAAYGTFEDEPPLLEGEDFASNMCSNFAVDPAPHTLQYLGTW